MSNPTSNSGKFMDKKLQALVNETPPLALFPSFIIYYNIYFNKNRYYQSHLSQCNLISVFIF
ncbi:ST43 protein [Escherichia coli DEC8D]|nr:ST43 protein [Escherichia coli DEC8D]